MKIKKVNDRIYFNYNNKSFANVSIKGNNIKLELLETLPKFRNSHFASNLMQDIINYLKSLDTYKMIYLNPLPLDRFGLELEDLIKFYKKFNFYESSKKDIHCPFLMQRAIL